MATLDRRKFLQMVGLGSAVALLPPMGTAMVTEPGSDLFEFGDEDFTIEFTIHFNEVLADDDDSRYALFYADKVDSDGNPILIQEGKLNGRREIKVQVEDNSEIVCRALGLQHAQFTEARAWAQKEPSMNVIGAVERNFVNA